MDELQAETGPVNAYAKIFFWIWGLALLAVAGIKAGNTAYQVELDSLQQETNWLNLAIQQTKSAAAITDFFQPFVHYF
jgi:hypothetical protein